MVKILLLLLTIQLNYSHQRSLSIKEFYSVSEEITKKSPKYIKSLLLNHFGALKERVSFKESHLLLFKQESLRVTALLKLIINKVETIEILNEINKDLSIFSSKEKRYFLNLQLQRAVKFGSKKDYHKALYAYTKDGRVILKVESYGISEAMAEESLVNRNFLKVLENTRDYLISLKDNRIGSGVSRYVEIANFIIDNNGVNESTLKKALQSENEYINVWAVKKIGAKKIEPLYNDILLFHNKHVRSYSDAYKYFDFDKYFPYKLENLFGLQPLPLNAPIREGF